MSVCNEESLDPGQKPDGERQGTRKLVSVVAQNFAATIHHPPL